MPLTVNEYAIIADKVYDETQTGGGPALVPGFTCARLVTDRTHGFKGAIYTRGNDCVVAFKGTETAKGISQSIMDLAADYRLMAGKIPTQVAPAAKLLAYAQANFGAMTIVICGHSLGGGLAQVVGYRANAPFITFNAPPMATNVDASWAKTMRSVFSKLPGGKITYPMMSQVAQAVARGKDIGAGLGVNLRMKTDIVSASFWGGDHVGDVITIPTDLDAGSAHFMAAVKKAILMTIGMKKVTVT